MMVIFLMGCIFNVPYECILSMGHFVLKRTLFGQIVLLFTIPLRAVGATVSELRNLDWVQRNEPWLPRLLGHRLPQQHPRGVAPTMPLHRRPHANDPRSSRVRVFPLDLRKFNLLELRGSCLNCRFCVRSNSNLFPSLPQPFVSDFWPCTACKIPMQSSY